MPDVTLVAGGVPLRAGGEIIGAVGVGGAPSGLTDEDIAQTGANVLNQ